MKILVVDDNEAVREVVKRALEEDKHFIILARSAEVGIDILKDNRDIDAVLCDIIMPGMSGMVAVKEFRAIKSDLFICLLTGYNQSYTENEIVKKGADCFLAKPFLIKELSKLIVEAARKMSK